MPHHGSCSISKTLQTITTLRHRARQINNYCPAVELIGNIAATIRQLTPLVSRYTSDPANSKMLAKIVQDRQQLARESAALNGMPVHPLRIVSELQSLLTPDSTLCLDMGSFHLWMARHLYGFRAKQVLTPSFALPVQP